MSAFVLDASVAMRWAFRQPAPHPAAEQVLDRLMASDRAVVPILWLYEVMSVVTKTQRMGSISAAAADEFLNDLSLLEISIDELSQTAVFQGARRLAIAYGLTGYDAVYLELAQRLQLPLATLDDELRKAAQLAGVRLLF
ncbi:MAG: type II toxin-antitoxin system VapC family toxin [Acidobacteria bacterium]|nr:type II toxin-antitoxin system VapC family toxin [Acidobacteriota bacterium]